MSDVPRAGPGIPIPNIGTVDVVLKLTERYVAVYKVVCGWSVVVGALVTPIILFADSGLINPLLPLVSSGSGATAIGAFPLALYLRWSSRRMVCSDYRRLLDLYVRNQSRVDSAGFEVATDAFWSLYREVTR